MTESAAAAVLQYTAIADEVGVLLTEVALRFVLDHSLVCSAVVGASSIAQWRELVAAAEAGPLSADLRERLDAVHVCYPNPCP